LLPNWGSRCCHRWCFALTPGDYSAQCLSLKSAGANYAYLGNTAASDISVLKACKVAGVDVQFMASLGHGLKTPPRPRAMPPTA